MPLQRRHAIAIAHEGCVALEQLWPAWVRPLLTVIKLNVFDSAAAAKEAPIQRRQGLVWLQQGSICSAGCLRSGRICVSQAIPDADRSCAEQR